MKRYEDWEDFGFEDPRADEVEDYAGVLQFHSKSVAAEVLDGLKPVLPLIQAVKEYEAKMAAIRADFDAQMDALEDQINARRRAEAEANGTLAFPIPRYSDTKK